MTDLDAWARSLGWASYLERQDAIAKNEARYARGLAWQQEHAAELKILARAAGAPRQRGVEP